MRLGDCGKTNLHTYSDKEKWSLIRYLDTGSITEGRIVFVNKKVSQKGVKKVSTFNTQ